MHADFPECIVRVPSSWLTPPPPKAQLPPKALFWLNTQIVQLIEHMGRYGGGGLWGLQPPPFGFGLIGW